MLSVLQPRQRSREESESCHCGRSSLSATAPVLGAKWHKGFRQEQEVMVQKKKSADIPSNLVLITYVIQQIRNILDLMPKISEKQG